MMLTKKLKNLNKSFSYNLFAILGIFILVFEIYYLLKGYYSYEYALAIYLIFPACFIIIFIISVFELIFHLKITNEKFLSNKLLNAIKTIGAIIAIIYILLVVVFFIFALMTISR